MRVCPWEWEIKACLPSALSALRHSPGDLTRSKALMSGVFRKGRIGLPYFLRSIFKGRGKKCDSLALSQLLLDV